VAPPVDAGGALRPGLAPVGAVEVAFACGDVGEPRQFVRGEIAPRVYGRYRRPIVEQVDRLGQYSGGQYGSS